MLTTPLIRFAPVPHDTTARTVDRNATRLDMTTLAARPGDARDGVIRADSSDKRPIQVTLQRGPYSHQPEPSYSDPLDEQQRVPYIR